MTDLSGVRDIQYRIRLKPNAQPKRPRQYRYAPHMRQIIDKELETWQSADIVEEGDAEWLHPVVLVKEKPINPQGNEPPKYRMCLDLREINKHIKIDSYPIPTIQSITESIGSPAPQFFTSLDCFHGFLQIRMHHESSRLLGIQTDTKTFRLKRLPFVLATSPYVYQKLMNKLFSGYLYIFTVAYIDDVITYSRDFKTHLHHLRLVLDRFRDTGLRLLS